MRTGCSFNARLIRDPEAGCLLMLSPVRPAAGELVCAPEKVPSVNLTAREIEVLRWVEQGMGNADIAVLCAISVRTVHKHLEHVFDKLNVENPMAAVRNARELLSGQRTT